MTNFGFIGILGLRTTWVETADHGGSALRLKLQVFLIGKLKRWVGWKQVGDRTETVLLIQIVTDSR